jgi:hypothetical protein
VAILPTTLVFKPFKQFHRCAPFKSFKDARLGTSKFGNSRTPKLAEAIAVSSLSLTTINGELVVEKFLEVFESILLRPLERSEAVEPFDGLRAGSWNDWNSFRFLE